MKQKRGLAAFLLIGFMTITSISCPIRLAGAQVIPKEAKIHNQLGNDYCDKGEFEKGVVEYEKAIKLYPRYTDALYNVGLTYYLDVKDYAKAISFFRQFVQVEGESADAKQVKKWLAEAGQKLAAQKNAQPKNQQTEVAQAKSSPSGIGVQKESPQPKITPTVKPIEPPQVAGQAGQPPHDTAQATASPQEAVQAAAPPSEEAAQAGQPSQVSVREAEQPLIPKEESPAVVAATVTPPQSASQEPIEQQPPSREEQARIYKERGNNCNNKGKPAEAVKEYARALQIYPEYTDVLYNIAKTYDFNLKDYANAIRYYKQFLQYEPPSSRDAAQVNIWLGRVEESVQAQNKPESPKVAQPQNIQQAKIASTPAATAKAPGGKVLTRGKKAGDFYIKEFLSPTPVSAPPPVRGVPMEIRGEVDTKPNAEPNAEANAQPLLQEVVAATLPVGSPSESPAQTQAQSTGSREVLIETIIPKDLRAPDLIPMVMRRMQMEITEVLAQARVQSPEKLAELYLSKIQSDILPSGERISSFRLGGKELADLPNIRILTEVEKKDLEKEKWELIRTRKSPARLKEVLMFLRDGYRVVPQ